MQYQSWITAALINSFSQAPPMINCAQLGMDAPSVTKPAFACQPRREGPIYPKSYTSSHCPAAWQPAGLNSSSPTNSEYAGRKLKIKTMASRYAGDRNVQLPPFCHVSKALPARIN